MNRRRVFRNEESFHILLLVITLIIAVWSGIKPYDSLLWLSNISVAIIYAVCFIFTYRKFRFTSFAYVMIFIHLVIILVAAKYTYENTPLFSMLRDSLGQSRNYFDRIGHFFQGFVPILLAKELFIRNDYMKKSKFFYLVIVFFVLAISASWELLEFAAAVIFDQSDAYILSMQGDIWDAQWDMICAITGAITSLLIFNRYHDKKIKEADAK
ncbi:DUF2238 domain-containing protein [Mycoplasmatota bacterium]|nr:DUF2238 domain-containing protein [Mycoplasmatota bacterium]